MLAAICFCNGYVKIAAGRNLSYIGDFEWARRNVGFIERIAMLFYGYPGVALGDTANNGRKPLLAVRQHIVI